jgi:acyl carrier protein
MDRIEILKSVNEIFVKSLNNPNIQLSENTCSRDIKEWDSLTNIVLISAIEKHFKIKFSLDDIYNSKNVGDLCKIIESKI